MVTSPQGMEMASFAENAVSVHRPIRSNKNLRQFRSSLAVSSPAVRNRRFVRLSVLSGTLVAIQRMLSARFIKARLAT